MLIACDACRRQYDVGDRPVGSKIRCYCGTVAVVPDVQVRPAVMQRCSSCGARLRKGATRCDFCTSEVTLGERGWGDACPQCFARMVRDASFCSTCGTTIDPHPLRKSDAEEICPVCDEVMAVCDGPDGAVWVECTSCGGIWLEGSVFRKLVEAREESGLVAMLTTPHVPGDTPRPPRETKVVYRKCPVCGKIMNRKNFARSSNVMIDACSHHGFWFDAHELESILRFVQGGGMARAQKTATVKAQLESELRYYGERRRAEDIRAATDRGMFGAIHTFARTY